MGSRTAGYATRYGISARHGAHVAGFADNRWNKYNGGNGLEPEVWLINVNDGLLGVVVAAALFHHFRSTGPLDRWSHASKAVVLLTLLRDATLLRETIEYVDSHASVARCSISRVGRYMWDHHRKDYPHTTTDPALRPHGIALLWLINVMWLVAPLLTLVWAWQQLDVRQALCLPSNGYAKVNGRWAKLE